MKAGTTVCLKADPGRVGTTTGRTRQAAGRTFWQVHFPDGHEYVPEGQLLVRENGPQDPIELLEQGRLGRATDLRKRMTFCRLSGKLADLIYSMGTTNTDFYAYQFKPVLSFLDSPTNGILIADEVGLGKTIEAGLILTEMRSRYDIKRVLILCPAMLQGKWQFELSRKFGIEAAVMNSAQILQKFKESAGNDGKPFTLIGSIQGLRPRKGRDGGGNSERNPASLTQFLEKVEYEDALLDLLIIDEAHYLRNPESATAKLGRLLRSVAESVVLLSATPIHLRNEDLYQLLKIVDEDTFSRPDTFSEILRANAPLIRARELITKKTAEPEEILAELRRATTHPFLTENRQLAALLDSPPTAEDMQNKTFLTDLAGRLERLNLLGRVVTRTRRREVQSLRVLREAVPEVIKATPAERGFYEGVTGLVREYANKRLAHEAFLSVMPQRQMSSSMPAALEFWSRRGERLASGRVAEESYEDFGNGGDPQEYGPLTTELAQRARGLGNLSQLYDSDSKYARLRKVLLDLLHRDRREKVVLFSYFRPTLKYLSKRLTRDGISNIVLLGGAGYNKDAILDAFRSPGGPSVLLSSEVASEGIDLQFARFLVNYDLPWNPMKVEQRIGRIDRLGQKAPKIFIWNLFYENTIDARIYERLHKRLKIFEGALGGLEAIIGERIQQLTMELLREELTPEQEEERIEQTARALENLRAEENRLEAEASNLVAHGDYILTQIEAARQMQRWIDDEDLWICVHDFLLKHYPGCEFRQIREEELLFDVKLSDQAKADFESFLDKMDLRGKTRLNSPQPAPVRCRFQNRVGGEDRERVEQINQFHPLVRFVSWSLREGRDDFYPVVSVEIPAFEIQPLDTGTYVSFVDLWSVEGVKNVERLYYAAKPVHAGSDFLADDLAERLVLVASRRGVDWLEASQTEDCTLAGAVARQCFERCYEAFETFTRQIDDENADRADVQARSIERHRDHQLARLQAVRQAHLEHGRPALVKATDGRIAALEARVRQRMLRIDKGRTIKSRRQEVCVALIKVV